MATIQDVARDAGVSTATVSRVFSAPELVLEATRGKVMEAVNRLGYEPNFAAKSLRTLRTEKILVTVPDISNPFFSQVIGGDTAAGRKPDPAGLLTIVAQANVAPSAAVMVGDSLVDAETARRAGTALCIARYGFGAPAGSLMPAAGEMAIDHPSELPDAIRSFRPDTGGARLPETSQSRT